jgi:hypothetical protein
MTPKEKADELLSKFVSINLSQVNELVDGIRIRLAKECAIIAVEEIILAAPFEPADTDWDEAGSSAQYWYPQKLEDSGKWWGAVKQELEKL